MNRSICLLIMASLVGLISGCFTPPTQAQYETYVAKIGYGSELPANWQAILKDFMQLRLKDADSAIWKIEENPFHSWAGEADSTGMRVAAGWAVRVLINAKNSYGGYTGFEKYQFIIRDGKVVAYAPDGGRFRQI